MSANIPINQSPQILNTSKNDVNNVAAACIRVSTPKQSKTGYSKDNQIELAKSYANSKGWTLPETLIFTEDKSASKISNKYTNTEDFIENFNSRPEFKDLLIAAQKKSFSHLILYSRDRATRVLQENIALEMFLKLNGIDIHYTKIGEQLKSDDNDMSRFINIILSSVAEYEASLISSRVKEGNRNCILKGFWAGGREPLDYNRKYLSPDSKNTTLSKSNFESDLVETIFNLYLNGYGYKAIADIMNQHYKFEYWTKSKIRGIIGNETYTGKLVWNRRSGKRNNFKKNSKVIFSPEIDGCKIIEHDLWKETVSSREIRNKSKDAFYYNTPFILKHKLYCPYCKNKLLFPKNPGKNKSNIYMCKASNCNYKIKADTAHSLFKNQVHIPITESSLSFLWNSYSSAFDERKNKELKFLEELDLKINNTKKQKSLVANTIDYQDKLISSKIKSNTSYKNELTIKSACEKQHILLCKTLEGFYSVKDSYELNCIGSKLSKRAFEDILSLGIENLLDIIEKGKMLTLKHPTKYLSLINYSGGDLFSCLLTLYI